jgi:hypothetical protein
MVRFMRRALIPLFLTWYGLVSLSGVALHGLLETGPSHHAHGLLSGGPTVSSTTNHCPLCEFQAQGQLPLDQPLIVCRQLVRPHAPLHRACAPSARPYLSFSPRAPPISVMILV